MACTILDTGCRIEELLTAGVENFDFDNLLLTVVGKGLRRWADGTPLSPAQRIRKERLKALLAG